VSVIVPVRNGADVLPGLIDALAQQTIDRERFEVVIGDDGSTDGGTDGLETADGWIRVSSGPSLTRTAARNRAVRESRGSILAFCDADCVPEPGWLEAGIEALESADVAGGAIRPLLRGRATIWTKIDIDTFVDPERSIRTGGLLSGNFFIRRDLFDAVGGFDEALSRTGDFDFARRCHEADARIVFHPEAAVSHPTYDRMTPFIRKFWGVNWWSAWNETRRGRRPYLVRLVAWVPVVLPAHSRRAMDKPLGLNTERLNSNGVPTRRLDLALALPILYLVLPYVAASAQLAGWRSGRQTPAQQPAEPAQA
jgi:glycosyltransferase involved in cell wall biosynthesis